MNYDTIPVNEKLRARDELINLYSSQSILIYLIFSIFHILLLCCSIFYILISKMVFYGKSRKWLHNLLPPIFQLLVDYFGIFVAFGRLRVIYLSCWQNIKHQSRFSIWPLEFLCCWYHRVWYSALYFGQYISVSYSLVN